MHAPLSSFIQYISYCSVRHSAFLFSIMDSIGTFMEYHIPKHQSVLAKAEVSLVWKTDSYAYPPKTQTQRSPIKPTNQPKAPPPQVSEGICCLFSIKIKMQKASLVALQLTLKRQKLSKFQLYAEFLCWLHTHGYHDETGGIMANARNYFPLSFSWLLRKLNRLNPYPAIHFGSSKCAGGRSAATEEPRQACAGSSAWAGGLEGRSVSGLFNQLSTAQQGPTEIRANRLVFLSLPLTSPSTSYKL